MTDVQAAAPPDGLDLDRLAELAEAATPGPWRNSGNGCVDDANRNSLALCNRPNNHRADAAYIAALSPDVVLRLIAALRAIR